MRAVVPRALRARGTLPRSFPRHDQMTNAHRAAASAGMTLPFGVEFDANAKTSHFYLSLWPSPSALRHHRLVAWWGTHIRFPTPGFFASQSTCIAIGHWPLSLTR